MFQWIHEGAIKKGLKILQRGHHKEKRGFGWRKCTPAMCVKGYALNKTDDKKNWFATELSVVLRTLSVLLFRDMQLIFSLYVFFIIIVSEHVHTIIFTPRRGTFCISSTRPCSRLTWWVWHVERQRVMSRTHTHKMEMTYAKTFTLWNYLMECCNSGLLESIE